MKTFKQLAEEIKKQTIFHKHRAGDVVEFKKHSGHSVPVGTKGTVAPANIHKYGGKFIGHSEHVKVDYHIGGEHKSIIVHHSGIKKIK